MFSLITETVSINRADFRLSRPDSPLRCGVKEPLYFFVYDDALVGLGPRHLKKTSAFGGCTDDLAVSISVVNPCDRRSFFFKIRSAVLGKSDEDSIEQDGRPARELKLGLYQ